MLGEMEIDGETSSVNATRKLRSEYRELIANTEVERQVLLQSETSKLTDRIRRANQLFESVESPQEATLDSALLLKTADIASQKLITLNLGTGGFDFDDFIRRVGDYMKPNEAAVRPAARNLDWKKLSSIVQKHSLRVPTTGFMLGAIGIIAKEKTVRKQTVKLVKDPRKLQDVKQLREEDVVVEKNDTSSNVQAIYLKLEQQFFINPDSFSQSVENLFYISFLVRDAKASLTYDEENDELRLDTREPPTDADIAENDCSRLQNVFELDQAMWRDIIRAYSITESIIPNRVSGLGQIQEPGKWYC